MCRKLFILRIRRKLQLTTIRQLHKGNQSKEMITLFLPVDEDWFPSGFVPESLKKPLKCINIYVPRVVLLTFSSRHIVLS